MKNCIFLAIIISFYPLTISAKGCQRVNLLYKKWGLFPRQMPLYDQGKNGICYAYSAAQLVDYWRETHSVQFKNMKMAQSTPVYAALLARMYEQTPGYVSKATLSYGTVYGALMGIKTYGMCQEKVIEDSLNRFAKSKKINTKDFLYETERYLTQHKPYRKKGVFRKYFMEPFENFKRKYRASEIDFKRVNETMKPFLNSQDYISFMKAIFGDCFKKENIYLDTRRIPIPKVMEMDQNAILMEEKVKELLNKKTKAQPIGIGYCQNILEKSNYLGINHKRVTPQVLRGCHGHASLIVGKRERGGRCQFLVRNTYGTHCKYDWECMKNKKGEALGIWVDAKALMKNTRRIYYLED